MLKLTLGSSLTSISPLLCAAILVGSALGIYMPSASALLGAGVDGILMVLMTLLLFGVRFDAILQGWRNTRFIAIALLSNFVLVPLIGYFIASNFLPTNPLFMVGLMIYFMAPCTDWFLGFTRLAKGNVALGAALIPVNMVVQLLLYPLYLSLFTRNIVRLDASMIASTLWQWFMVPLAVAVCARYALRCLTTTACFERVWRLSDQATPWAIAALIITLFAANIDVLLAHSEALAWMLLAVFMYFLTTFLLGEAISRFARLKYPEHALLTMTTAARNAPLMLVITMIALPDQPLVYAAIVIGMLLEFPHLTLLQRLLISRSARASEEALG